MSRRGEISHPFAGKFGNAVGRGQDSVAVPLVPDRNLPDEIRTTDRIIKWNHDDGSENDKEVAMAGLLYRKKKYEIAKFFLGDFVPESAFVLGTKNDGGKIKIKGYTVQDRVPQFSLNDLSDEQKNDPVLHQNLILLALKLQRMLRAIEEVNEEVEEDAKIDARLDLGGLSELAMNLPLDPDQVFDTKIAASPNLLVNPETMQLYCIDFGSGRWSEKKEATLRKLIATTETPTI